MINHDSAATWQGHGAGIGRFNLVFNLEATKQRCVVAVALYPGCVLGHHVGHELLGLLVHVVGVDQDVADVVVEVITDGADYQRGLLVNQVRALATLGGTVDGRPKLQQVIQVPLQLRRSAADTGGARNDRHAVGVFQLVQRFFQFSPVFAFNATGHATTAGVVGHQDHIAARQGHKRGQGCALIAAFFFFDLNQQFLAFADGILNARIAGRDALLEVGFGYFLEWQKTMTVFAVIYKTSFQ